jgi:Xaa-Pro aminopeptidase
MRKSPSEIISIQKASEVSDLALKNVLKIIKDGISEKELANKITTFLKINGNGIAFRPIVSFGENTSEIHHRPTNRKLKKGDVIMIDLGAKINSQCSDITRTFFYKNASKEQKRIYKLVYSSQQKAVKYINQRLKNNKKLSAKKVDKVARDFLKIKGFDLPHSLGHGVGKKIHQGPKLSPKSKNLLKEGFVFTIEPGVYLKHYGIRIEDTVIIENNKIKELTKFKKDILIIDN